MSAASSPVPSYESIRNDLRAFVAHFYPGRAFKYAAIYIEGCDMPVQVVEHSGGVLIPLPPHLMTGLDTAAAEETAAGHEHFSKCILDILETLEEAKKPLTETRLLSAMWKAGREWSKTTVETYLKMMMEDGTIENPKDGKPRGYRLPEWDTQG